MTVYLIYTQGKTGFVDTFRNSSKKIIQPGKTQHEKNVS